MYFVDSPRGLEIDLIVSYHKERVSVSHFWPSTLIKNLTVLSLHSEVPCNCKKLVNFVWFYFGVTEWSIFISRRLMDFLLTFITRILRVTRHSCVFLLVFFSSIAIYLFSSLSCFSIFNIFSWYIFKPRLLKLFTRFLRINSSSFLVV